VLDAASGSVSRPGLDKSKVSAGIEIGVLF
jgi:hypothetical protein